MAASTAPRSRGLTVVVSVTLLYLGVAALRLADHDGVWPTWGAATVLVAAGLFLVSLRPGLAGRSSTP